MTARPFNHFQTAWLLLVGSLVAFLFFASTRLNHDSAWLIEATRRWRDGARLYVDIIEVNPPLIFYDTLLLSGGFATKLTFIGGVCAATGLSALWALRLKGPLAAIAALLACSLAGLTDFGQRDHLALIFVIPFLLGSNAGRTERILIAGFAFLGVGLKPVLLLMPLAAIAGQAFLDRSLRPFVSAQLITLGVLCLGYVAVVALGHPAYLSSIVPLGQFVYFAYGAALDPALAALSAAIAIAALIPMVSADRERIPLACAALAALASYYIQGRYWSYHLIPAVGLGIFISIWADSNRFSRWTMAGALMLLQLWRGPYVGMPPSPIPMGAKSVAFLSPHVGAAYPTALDCGVRNATRYPAIWVVPGAWNILHDPTRSAADRMRAQGILQAERATIRQDILTGRPQFIYLDARERKPYFGAPFSFPDYIGPIAGYRYVGRNVGPAWIYDIWAAEGASFGGPKCDPSRPSRWHLKAPW